MPNKQLVAENNQEYKDLDDYKGRVKDLPLSKVKRLTHSTQWNLRANAARKAGALMNRLYNCSMGNTEMSSVQLRAATTFLDRCLPAMQSLDIQETSDAPQSRTELMGRAQQLISDNPQLLALLVASNPELVKALPQLLRQQAAAIQDKVEDSEAIDQGVDQDD